MRLTALRSNNPVAVMAAYGALRLLPEARLRWEGTHPELDWDGDPFDFLAGRLEERLIAPEATLLDDPRKIGGVDAYRKLARQMPTEWLIAYASETKDGVRKMDLLLLGGPHRPVANARAIMTALGKQPVAEKLREALLGPWRYEDRDLQAWGWDAAARIDASSSVKAVTSAPKFGVLGAYWLAWESLPFWPMINGQTIGMEWNQSQRQRYWTYPTCSEWLGAEGLRALVLGAARMHRIERSALGVRVWCSECVKSGKDGSVLGWAAPALARAQSDRQGAGRFAPSEKPGQSIA